MNKQSIRSSYSIVSFCLVFAVYCGRVGAADTRLADVIEKREFSLAKSLIESTGNVDVAQADGMTALHWAAHHDDPSCVRQLLAAGANATVVTRYGITPLYLACRNGSYETAMMLLDAGGDPNQTMAGGETVLMVAARTGDLKTVDLLIENGADVNAKERKGQTALMWAAAEGNLAVVETLLRAEADYQTPLPSGFTPFFFAVRQGHTQVALRLLQAGLDVNQPIKPKRVASKGPKRGTPALMLAINNGHFETALALLDAGADVNDDNAGYTPLHAMTWVRKPIRGDGDPPPRGSGAITSLQFVRELTQRGADVNASHGPHSPPELRLNRTDATPLLLAAETGDLPLLRILVQAGADPRRSNSEGCTPLLAACGVGVISNGDETAGTEQDAIETVRFLLSLEADINAVDNHGHSAMHGAAYKSWTRLIKFLSDQGAVMEVWNQKNRRGWTPLKIAQGSRPGNVRPSSETIQAIEEVLQKATSDQP